MTYSIIKLTAAPPDVVTPFIKTYSSENYSYDKIIEIYKEQFSDQPWIDYLSQYGVSGSLIVPNIPILQQTWANEYGVKEECYNIDFVINQIKYYNPDIIFLDNLYYFDEKYRKKIRTSLNNSCKIIGWRSAPTNNFSSFQDLDLVLSSLPPLVDQFNQHNVKSKILAACFNEKKDELLKSCSKDISFSFIGSMGFPHGSLSKRVNSIIQLLEETPLEVWGDYHYNGYCNKQKYLNLTHYYSRNVISILLKKFNIKNNNYDMNKYDIEKLLKYYAYRKKFSTRIHPQIYGDGYYKVLGSSIITFNSHLNIAFNYAVNMRLFDATGMGACLLTENTQNIHDFFIPNEEVICYNNINECINKVNELIKDPDFCIEIGLKGKRRVMRCHTYKHRAALLHEYLLDLLND